MRRDRERMLDILEALDSLTQSLRHSNEKEFFSDDLIYSASAYKLTIIGEAAAGMSDEMKARQPEIEWRKVIGLRNVLVHQYFGIDRPMVWEVAITEAPVLRDQIAAIVLAEFPE
jgi:uncharacterized protein with HEPN domain